MTVTTRFYSCDIIAPSFAGDNLFALRQHICKDKSWRSGVRLRKGATAVRRGVQSARCRIRSGEAFMGSFFLLNDKYTVSAAQSINVFKKTLEARLAGCMSSNEQTARVGFLVVSWNAITASLRGYPPRGGTLLQVI